jgi:hypothetical protein
VSSTSQLYVVDDRRSSIRKRHDVMRLEEAALGASPARADERALTAVAPPDRSSYRCRDISGARSRAAARPLRSRHPGELGLLQMLEQHRQRSFENGSHISVGACVSHQVLNARQFVKRLSGDRELHSVVLSSDRFDDGRLRLSWRHGGLGSGLSLKFVF